jgi:predicted oxidoreductase (fatty acid repression mutant protein)
MATTVLSNDLGHYLALLEQRRTIRELTSGPMESRLLTDLAQAVALTPAAFNRPPWRVVIVHERRHAFWETVELAIQTKLEGDRRDRYIQRLEQFRSGLGAVLIYEDRHIVQDLQRERQLTAETAASYVQQALGMLQLSLWLTLTNHGMGTSLQHWEWLLKDELVAHTGLPVDDFSLVAVMPFGFPGEAPPPSTRNDIADLIAIDAPFQF